MSRHKPTLESIVAIACFAALPALVVSANPFSITIGAHDNLVIQSANGSTLADIARGSVGRTVTVDHASFEVSFGGDVDGQLTAILNPPETGKASLHFSAGGKSIDANEAVVTLTFARDGHGVMVDPGYVGTVQVDSHLLSARSLADDQPLPPSAVLSPNFAPASTDATAVQSTPSAEVATVAPAPASSEVAQPSPMPDASADAAPAPASAEIAATATPPPTASASSTPASFASPSVLPTLASQLAPVLPPLGSASSSPAPTESTQPELAVRRSLAMTTAPSAGGSSAQGGIQHVKLFWSEPVTAPDGSAPVVAVDEIKLVEVHGTVSVVEPNGTSQIGQEGMIVPSGSMVRAWDNSSAALFMGGVNSARLMPKCELVVTQSLSGSVRTDLVELRTGAVFSRVGHRDGETENYSVTTPEGSSKAGAGDMLAYRGSPGDLRAVSTARAGLSFDPKRLLAWNPAPSRGLISDVPLASLGIPTSIGNIASTYFYYTGGYRLCLTANQIQHEVLTNFSPNADSPGQSEPDFVLQAILTDLQPYNKKLNSLLKAINNGTESSAQLTYYHNLITVFFDEQAPTLVQDFLNHKSGFYRELNVDSAILWQDLREFTLPSLTPH